MRRYSLDPSRDGTLKLQGLFLGLLHPLGAHSTFFPFARGRVVFHSRTFGCFSSSSVWKRHNLDPSSCWSGPKDRLRLMILLFSFHPDAIDGVHHDGDLYSRALCCPCLPFDPGPLLETTACTNSSRYLQPHSLDWPPFLTDLLFLFERATSAFSLSTIGLQECCCFPSVKRPSSEVLTGWSKGPPWATAALLSPPHGDSLL